MVQGSLRAPPGGADRAMRALRFHAARDLRIEDVAEPGPPGPTQVTVAPRCCGICGTDLHEYTSGPIVTPSSPHPLTGATLREILGHELSAEVVAVGSAVNRVEVGDRVSVMPLIYCGRCDYCRRGLQPRGVTVGGTRRLLPPRPSAPVRDDGLHRSQRGLGRHLAAREPRGVPGVPHPGLGL